MVRKLRCGKVLTADPRAAAIADPSDPRSKAHHHVDPRQGAPFDVHGSPQKARAPPGGGVMLLRLPEVLARTALSRSTVYLMMDEGRFPGQVRLTDKAVGWLESEILEWISQRVAARNASPQHKRRAQHAEAFVSDG